MTRHRQRPGFSAIELVIGLAILAILLGLAVPPLDRARDRFAARGARDTLAAGLARARALAVARGGANLVVDVAAARYWVESPEGDTLAAPIDLARLYRVTLTVDGGGAERLALRFDGLGIGRMVNRTFRLRRGSAESRLTLSSYGRPRSW